MKITEIPLESKTFISFTASSINYTLTVRIKGFTNNGVFLSLLNLHDDLKPIINSIDESLVDLKVSKRATVVKWKDLKPVVRLLKGKVLLYLETDELGVEDNERDSYRLRFIYDTLLTLQDEDHKNNYVIAIKDISTKGIGFESNHNFSIGDNVKVILPLEASTTKVDASILRKIKKSESRFLYGASVNPEGIIVKIVGEEQRRQLRER